jgi:hypothetical protein
VDGCTTKAPCGGQVAGPSPVDRRKQGLKRSVAVEADGMPLAAVPAPANQRDDGLLAATLDAITVVGPLPERPVVHLDAGDDDQPCRQVLAARGHGRRDRRWWGASPDPGRSPMGDRAHPRLGQPVRQAALVNRAPPGGRRVLAGAGQRRHRRWPTGPPRLDLLPLAGPPSPPPVTTYWRSPLHRRGHVTGTHARPQPDLTGRHQTYNTAPDLHSSRSEAVL